MSGYWYYDCEERNRLSFYMNIVVIFVLFLILIYVNLLGSFSGQNILYGSSLVHYIFICCVGRLC